MSINEAWKSHKQNTKSSSSGGTHSSSRSQGDIKTNLQSTANPSFAMNEAQPAALAFEKSTNGYLSHSQYRDAKGEVITEPDLTNPTRYRYERPLDTIRSFERAIRRTHKAD